MVSSARIPNESYAQRAKKASTSSTTSRTTLQNQQQPAHVVPAQPPSLAQPPRVNVWAERIREQQAHAAPQPARMPRQRATSSPQLPREDPIPPRSPPPDLSVQLAILDQQDEHDPFVVRVPPHLSRPSSSSTNPLPATDPAAWPQLGSDPHSIPSSPFLSAAPSRQNSSASFRHHAYSPSGSVRLSRVQSSFSQRSRSPSQPGAHSRSSSSASCPSLEIRGRPLPQADPLPPDLRLDHPLPRSSSISPTLLDRPNIISSPFQADPVRPPIDPPYYRGPPADMPSRYTHNFPLQYALPPQFTPAHAPGHTSPPYIPHSGQGTPPYSHYPPYPAYMYGHPSLYWGDIPPHSHSHLQNQLAAHINPSEHSVPHKMEFGSISPPITSESGASQQNGWQPGPSKSVVFGTIDSAESQDDQTAPSSDTGQRTAVENATEQFATFSIGVRPDEPGPSRLASRKSSARSLSRTLSTNDGTKDANPPSREVNGIKKSIKWEFGTTLSEDLDDPRHPSSPPPSSCPPPNHQNESGTDHVEDQPDLGHIPPSRADRSTDKSETESPTSDVWVVKDYGYGFGDHSEFGNATDIMRWDMREREKVHLRVGHREQGAIRDQHRDRVWEPARESGWRRENGVEEGREVWEQQQQANIDTPRHMRPRRGSFPGYGGHDRGGFATRRGRGFGGRFHGGRGRGGYFHHQRPGSFPYVPPPPQPFEVLPPAIDMVNGYGQPSYAPPELESYEAVPLVPQPHAPFTSAAYSVDAMQSYLLAQLEYYLSPQNMAQDFYLRQRMDNEGWIPISLLASFKRVQRLQTDTDIVKEVLSRSGTVEVNGDWARMGGRQWEVFVLPTAPKSVVTGANRGEGKGSRPAPYHDGDAYARIEGDHGETDGDCDGEDCEGDDEDDDVEFVIGEEAEGSWMPVPERKQ